MIFADGVIPVSDIISQKWRVVSIQTVPLLNYITFRILDKIYLLARVWLLNGSLNCGGELLRHESSDKYGLNDAESNRRVFRKRINWQMWILVKSLELIRQNEAYLI